MSQIKHSLNLYEISKFLYIEGNVLLLKWASYSLKNREISKVIVCNFIIKYTDFIVEIYPKILLNSLIYIQQAIQITTDDYMCLLLESILLYNQGKIKPAILSFRRAFNLRNKDYNNPDPFYKRSFLEKRKLYENKILEVNWNNINDDVLRLDCEDNNNHNKKDILTLEQLKQALAKHEKINSQIEILQNSLKKSNQKEIIEFILEYTKDFFNSEISCRYDFFYIHGDSLLKLYFLEDEFVDFTKILNIYKQGLRLVTDKEGDTVNKIKNYKISIINLIKKLDKKLTTQREYIGINAIREISLIKHDTSKHIEENKYLCLCDIYIEIGKYFESIKSYLEATNFLDSSNFYAPLKYSDKLITILKKIDIEEMKKLLFDIVNDKNLKYNSQIYWKMWWLIGKKIYLQTKKSKSKSKDNYLISIKAYSEALTSPYQDYMAKILFSRGIVYMETKNLSASEEDFEQALEINQKKSLNHEKINILTLHEYRTLLRKLAEIKFQKRMDFQYFSDIKYFFNKELQFYEQCINNNKSELSYYFPFDKDPKREYINQCYQRIAVIYYVEGFSFYKICETRQKSRLSFKIEIYIRYLEQSLSAYRKALKEMQENIVIRQEEDYSTDYFMLEIITGFITTSYALLENRGVKKQVYKKYQEYYKETQEYLKMASEILGKLVKAKEEGKLNNKKYKYIQESNFQKKFEIIEGFKISYFDPKIALQQAEIRKYICLARLSPYKKNHNFSYERIRKILRPQTAVIYWHIGMMEVVSFILLNNQYTPIKNTIAIDYNKYMKLKRHIDTWELIISKAGKLSNINFLREMDNCLNNLYENLGIQYILEVLEKNEDIKNIIIIPHRYLHQIPLHIFFSGLYCAKDFQKDYSYTLSYLPSIELGLQLDSDFIYNPSLLVIKPLNQNNSFLFGSLVESAGIYLRFYDISSKVPEKLEESFNTTKEEVRKKLQLDINPSFLHFLGHARHNFNDRNNSWLELTGNEHLTLQYILNNFDFSNYYLVCLSACETGVTGTERPFKEYVGLVSAFLEAGANYVISSLWKVEDKPSALLMIEFYRLVSIRKHPVIALKKAQIWLRNASKEHLSDWCKCQASELHDILEKISITNQDKQKLKAYIKMLKTYANNFVESSEIYPYRHPYYWAGFTITGLPSFSQDD